MESVNIQTPLGIAKLEGDENGITALSVVEEGLPSSIIPFYFHEAVTQISAYFSGERKEFDLVLNPKGTDFQKEVWKSLQTIPYGKTSTYLDQSKLLGNVKAIRAVATAKGKNPLWIIIPCHRVIGSDGSLTGYAGGLWRKKWLLEHESPSHQQSLF